jgi:hypothetical protein
VRGPQGASRTHTVGPSDIILFEGEDMSKVSLHKLGKVEYGLPITLKGSSNIEYRLRFLSALLSQSEEKINHIDQSRQTNMNYALIIFAGLFGLGIGLEDIFYKLSISTAIFVLMGVFCFWDRRLHKISHGWQCSSTTFCEITSNVINNPKKNFSFPRYREDCEKKAEWFSFQPVIFYALIFGGLISFPLFYFL